MNKKFDFKQKAVKKALVFITCVLFLSTITKAQLPKAQEIAAKMKVGINLGNTLEAICGEDAWGAGHTSQLVIDSIKAAGFNTIRIPVAWFCHSDTATSTIDADWIARVKEVVDYCITADLYVIINAHWDKGWLENRVDTVNQSSVNQRQKAYWTQIAEYFKEYDERLLFAGANEPNVHDANAMEVLMTYHQTFIDAVRATGGNNSSRTLVVQGPSTDIDETNKLMTSMPNDEIDDRLIVEVHYYTPYQFCLMNEDASWGKMFYYWGKDYHSATDVTRNSTWGEESDVEKYFSMMKTQFVDKGIPVIIGEYGAYKRTLSSPSDQELHNGSVEYYLRYVVKSATEKGIITYYWDTPGGLFNRSTGAVRDRNVLNAIMVGAGIREPNYYSLDTTIMGSGTIKLSPDQANYQEGTAISLKAIASDNWTFESWGGDLNGSTNPTTLVVRKNQSVIANFSNNPLKIIEQMDYYNIKIFPNPFNTGIKVSIPNPNEINRIEVFDLLGKQVETIEKSSIKSSILIGTDLQSGTYIAKVYSAKGSKSFKIAKK